MDYFHRKNQIEPSNTIPRAKGFTLIELIAVLAILASIFTIGFGFVSHSLESYQRAKDISQLSMVSYKTIEQLKRMIRGAHAHSIEVSRGGQCLEFTPIKNGGRIRRDPESNAVLYFSSDQKRSSVPVDFERDAGQITYLAFSGQIVSENLGLGSVGLESMGLGKIGLGNIDSGIEELQIGSQLLPLKSIAKGVDVSSVVVDIRGTHNLEIDGRHAYLMDHIKQICIQQGRLVERLYDFRWSAGAINLYVGSDNDNHNDLVDKGSLVEEILLSDKIFGKNNTFFIDSAKGVKTRAGFKLSFGDESFHLPIESIVVVQNVVN